MSVRDDTRPRISIQDAAARLKGRVERDNQGRDVIRCPGPDHSAGDASLSVWIDDDEPGGIGVLSFSIKDSGDALRLKDWAREKLGWPPWKPNGKGNGHDREPTARDPVIAKYAYQTAMGDPVLLVSRTKAKKFWQQRPDGAGGWINGGILEKDKVPYRLPELIEAIGKGQTIYIVEGEKSADALWAKGFAATCSPGGAGKWPEHFAPWFAGAEVIVLPDNDLPGHKHADRVSENLDGIAASVRIINIPGLPTGGDVYDFMDAGGDPGTIATMVPGEPERGYRADLLLHASFTAISFAVPDVAAEGVTILAGAPKRGKSWLCLDFGVAVSSGGFTLGDRRCAEGDVLYCALEDNPRRMKSRLERVCQLTRRAPHRLTIWFGDDLPRLGEGCEERLREWATTQPKPRLIVIDTLNFIRPARTRDEDPYTYDYRSISPLVRIAAEFGIAIIVVHHTRKSEADDYLESISGTNGLTGGADAVAVLDRHDGEFVLKGRGRDIDEFEIAVRFDKGDCRWHVLADPEAIHRSEARSKILGHMREAGWFVTPAEIVTHTGLSRSTVDTQLFRMLKDGEVVKGGRGKYGLPDTTVEGGKDGGDE